MIGIICRAQRHLNAHLLLWPGNQKETEWHSARFLAVGMRLLKICVCRYVRIDVFHLNSFSCYELLCFACPMSFIDVMQILQWNEAVFAHYLWKVVRVPAKPRMISRTVALSVSLLFSGLYTFEAHDSEAFFLLLLIRLSSKNHIQPHLMPSVTPNHSNHCPLDIDLESIHSTFVPAEMK